MGMGTRFDYHFPSHKTGMLKPDRECFDNVVRVLDIAPDRILFLDDNEVNVLAAREAGLKAEQVVGALEVVERLEKLDLLQT